MYPPHHLGGYELSCRDVVDRWRTAGHEVDVLTTTMRRPGVDAGDPPFVHRELSFYWEDHEILRPPLRTTIAIERENQAVLQRLLHETRPDVVSVWHMGAMSMGLLTSIAETAIPMVLVVCDDWMIYGPDIDPWMGRFQRRGALGRIARRLTGLPASLPRFRDEDPFCFNSDWIRKRAQTRSRMHMPTTTVVYTGIDPRDFPIGSEQKTSWDWRLLCVGRQEERKGTHIAVRAMTHLPAEAELEIVGPGDPVYLDRLRVMVAELDLQRRVTFSEVPRHELRDRYTAADALLFPVTWDEPFGLVPVEAMACGTPVVATGTGGSAEFLADGVNCLIVPKSDDAALARAVLRLADDAELRGSLLAAGRATADELTVDRLAAVLTRWHDAAATRFAAGRPADLPAPIAGLRSDRKNPSSRA